MPIRLSPGSHSSPEEGVCVVELASVLAKERFSDRPRCVCPVIGAFLRGWNDRATHVERQLLAPYAAQIVGSRGDRHVTAARRDLCLEEAGADLGHRAARNALARAGMRLRIAVYCSLEAALRLNEGAGDYASRVIAVRGDATAALELLDALLAVGAPTPPEPGRPPSGVNGNGHAPAGANGNGNGSRNGGNGNGRLPDDLGLPSGADRSDSSAGELLRRG